MLNLLWNRNPAIESAYIITLKNVEQSTKLTRRCEKSCISVNMPYKLWEGYDGTGDTIKEPNHLQNNSFMSMIKLMDHYMTRSEVACALSHISLWHHCVVIDSPIVILEHDAIVVKKFTAVGTCNSITYLGGSEWATKQWPILSIPPMASDGPNNIFMCRAHAYAIDPLVAKNLLSYVLQHGITAPLDIMLRMDLFNISHQGLYAYDAPEGTTILNRPKDGRTTKRNDKLEW